MQSEGLGVAHETWVAVMVWRLISSAFVGWWMFNAVQMFGCNEVSFSGTGWTCWELPAGADPADYFTQGIPAWMVAIAILAVGGFLLFRWWVWPFVRNQDID